MKKFIALACAAVLTVASAVTAFAQPSVSVSGVVTAVTTATDKDGKAVNATLVRYRQSMPVQLLK